MPSTFDRIAAAYIDFGTSEPMAYRPEPALYFRASNNLPRAAAVGYYVRRQSMLEHVFVPAAQELHVGHEQFVLLRSEGSQGIVVAASAYPRTSPPDVLNEGDSFPISAGTCNCYRTSPIQR